MTTTTYDNHPNEDDNYTTGTIITAIISFLPFISHLPLPFSYSTETVASSSTSIKLNSIKRSFTNNMKGLLDFNSEHDNSDLFDNTDSSNRTSTCPCRQRWCQHHLLQRRQQHFLNTDQLSSMRRTSTSSSTRSPQASIFTTTTSTRASPTLLNHYDNLANSTPINLNDNPSPIEQINSFINNMWPTQRSTGTTTNQKYFICFTEAERLFYQQHQTLGQRRFGSTASSSQ